MVRKRNGKSEKTEKQKFKTADKISYFGQRRQLYKGFNSDIRSKLKPFLLQKLIQALIFGKMTLSQRFFCKQLILDKNFKIDRS